MNFSGVTMALSIQGNPTQGGREVGRRGWLWAALAVAVLGLGGSLYLSLGMGLKACPLCFYQRTFMMSLVAVLGMGLVLKIGSAGRLGLLAFPLASAGLGVALFHVSLELTGKLECPAGVLDLGTAPQQSLAAFGILFALLWGDAVRARTTTEVPAAALIGGVILGAVLAFASSISNPPMQAPPPESYTKPPDVCRSPLK
jgi:disulfide bond formation protein DsbB